MPQMNIYNNVDPKLRQDLIQRVYDKLTGVTIPDGDFESVLIREVDRAVGWVQNKVKKSLSPVRATNLPISPEEAYTDKRKYNKAIENNFETYPKWSDLTAGQKAIYGGNESIYTPGSLPWRYLTEEQQILFGTQVYYAPNKIKDEERLDGKGTAYIKLYNNPVIKVYSLALSFVSPPGYSGKNIFFRLYLPNEFLVYEKEGAIHIFPAVMARILSTTQDPLYGSQYGVVAPRIPQVMSVDYEYGYTEYTRPFGLVEAAALKAAMNLLLYISACMTGGLQSFGVDGFNASFNNGMVYEAMYKAYESELKNVLAPFFTPIMSSM